MRIVVRGLSSVTFLFDETNAPMKQVMVASPLPAVLKVPLPHIRLVHEPVVVGIMLCQVVLIVQ